MSREMVNAFCRTFPGAKVSDPWGGGHDAWKVGGKMFACIGPLRRESRSRLTAKLVRSSLTKKVQAQLDPFE